MLVVAVTLFYRNTHGYGRSGSDVVNAESISGPGGGYSIPATGTTTPMMPSSPTTSETTSATPAPTSSSVALVDKSCVPISISVPGHSVVASPVTTHPLEPSGELYVDRNPKVVSFLDYTKVGSLTGTAILTSHINYGGIQGVFHDLDTYQVGETISVDCTNGSNIKYTVVPAMLMGFKVDSSAPAVVSEPKDVLANDLHQNGTPLHQQLFDQTSSFAEPNSPATGRLLIVTCGGPFDRATGNYLNNYFVYALPAK
jgi:hypothetical protein